MYARRSFTLKTVRRLASILPIAFAALLTACSFTNSFIVVNASDAAIKVEYKVKRRADADMKHTFILTYK